eukprot:2662558-Pyramimonas_sp.AAC.2
MEQLGSSAEAKAAGKIVRRELVKVHTPATLVDNPVKEDAVHVLALLEEEVGPEDTERGASYEHDT